MCSKNEINGYLDTLLSHWANYHNHKETMAHVALAAQFAFVIAVTVSNYWPPSCWFWFWGIFIIWISLYLYTGWEIWSRRIAATTIKAIERTRGTLLSVITITDYPKQKYHDKCWKKILRWIHLIFIWLPWGWFTISRAKPTERKYPDILIHEIERAYQEGDIYLFIFEFVSFLLSICLGIFLLITNFLYGY